MRRLALPALALCLAACPPRPSTPANTATLTGDGFTVTVTAKPFALVVTDAAGAQRLATTSGPRFTLDQRTTEAQIVPGWDGTKNHEQPWTVFTDGVLADHDTTSATVTFASPGSPTVTCRVTVAGHLVRTAQSIDDPKHFNAAGLDLALAPDEHVFGMGQRTASVDHRGLALYSWPEEGGLGGGETTPRSANNPYPNGPSMTYFPVPLWHTTKGASVLVDTTRRSEVRFGSEADAPDATRVVVEGTALSLVVFVRDTPLQALDEYTALTGRPPLPAAWAYGPRRRVNREGLVDGIPEWKRMRDLSLPLTTIDDAMHSLPSYTQKGDEATYLAWTQLVHAHGYKVMDYNNPYVSQSAPNSAADYAYGAAQGYFEQAPDGGPATSFFLSGGAQTISTFDLTNPDAVLWFQSLLGRSFDLGYDGWMHDFGEYVARTSRFHDGRRGDEVHNDFPVLSAKAMYELVQSRRNGDAHVFTRSGYTGSQRWVLEDWGGDPEASFDETEGLPAMLRGGLNLGLVAVPYWSSDIGGYKCITDAPHDKEMLVRWYEMSALSPMMHDEDACSNPLGGNRVKARLWDDLETQEAWRQMAGLHTRLAPYFRALAAEAHATGAPITRHPFLLHPAEPGAWAVEDSFYVGRALYGAPVVRRGVTTRHVWLPPGRFVEWTDRTLHQGPGFADVPAPLLRLPLFLKENELVPLLDAQVQTLATATDGLTATEERFNDVLDVVAAVGPGGVATLTIVEGLTLKVTRLASDEGNPGLLPTATDATFSTCVPCGVKDTSGAVGRVRLVTGPAASATAQLGEVKVEVTGTPTRRVRWEVLTLP